MKYTLITLITLAILTSYAHAELTSDDLLNIQKIVKASETQMKDEIKASEDRMKEYVNIKFDSVNDRIKSVNERFGEVGGKINILTAIVCALIGLVGIVIALPLWRESKANRTLEKQIEILTRHSKNR